MADQAVPVVERLKAELPQMHEEHRAIAGALGQLEGAAREANRQDVIEFARRLKLHALMEEEILYPAAVLVGEYLKLRFER
jgi:hypothetical protein